jgi:WD40 repeat protein
MIETLSFSSDDSRIAVTKLNARDARIPGKIYKADVSRTVSWLDAATGASRGLIHQDFKPGKYGPAFHLWRVGRASAICNPSNDQIAISAFGGGEVIRNVDTAKPTVVSLMHPACNIAYSNSGRLLAASGRYQLTVLDTASDTVVMRVQTDDHPFLGASLMSFTTDDARIIVCGDRGVHVWDIATAKQRSTIIQGREPWIEFIAAAPNDNVVVGADGWVRRYDFDGNVVAALDNRGADVCAISSDGNRLAISGGDELTIHDLDSNKVLRSLSVPWVTALALSSSGDQLAVGDYDGRVTLIDTRTGKRRWVSNPPGRYRCPWTLPGAFLVAWICVAWRLFGRRSTVRRRELTVVAEA